MTAFESGARVGQYVLGREIGKGAMATVYEATHVELGKRVAVKVLHSHLAADPTASSRFLREGKAAAQIHSPHVVDVFDVGAHGGAPYLVMELLEGKDLGAFLRERGKLSPREIADIMAPICSAVDAAHAVGVIHRDLKPSNIMLAARSGGEIAPTILDFGISKLESDSARDLTASETLLGTVHYMSPEQTRGARTASARSDQYSIGVILYECATGKKPFAGATPYVLMHAIVSAKVATPSAIEPSVPASFDEVVLRAMNRDPARRFPSVRAIGAALMPFASDETRRRWATQLGADVAPDPRRPRARRAVVALVAVGLLCAALSAAYSRGSASPHPQAPPTPSPAPTPRPTPTLLQSTAPPPLSPPPAPAPPPPPAPARAVRPPPSAAASGRAATPRTPERGTNGAPIVE